VAQKVVLPKRVGSWSLTSLQNRLVKTGDWLVEHVRYYWLLLAESRLIRRLFGIMLGKIAALPIAGWTTDVCGTKKVASGRPRQGQMFRKCVPDSSGVGLSVVESPALATCDSCGSVIISHIGRGVEVNVPLDKETGCSDR
jgi:hypothetical protein